MRKRNERVGAQKLSIFDEFNGRNLVDDMFNLRVYMNILSLCVLEIEREREKARKCRNSEKPTFYART